LCEHGKEPLCSTKGKEFLDHISNYWHLKDNSAARFEVVTAHLLACDTVTEHVVSGMSRDQSIFIFRVKQCESPKSLLIEVGYTIQLLGYIHSPADKLQLLMGLLENGVYKLSKNLTAISKF
jgi:hypothetical protein